MFVWLVFKSIRGHICQGGWHIPCEVAAYLKCTMKRCCYVCGRRLPTLVQLWNLEPRFCRLLVSKPSVHLGAQTTELKHLYSRNYILAYSWIPFSHNHICAPLCTLHILICWQGSMHGKLVCHVAIDTCSLYIQGRDQIWRLSCLSFYTRFFCCRVFKKAAPNGKVCLHGMWPLDCDYRLWFHWFRMCNLALSLEVK